jgi:hypothetical protein
MVRAESGGNDASKRLCRERLSREGTMRVRS